MRVLMASDFYPPFIGGAERQVQLLSRELALRGHTVAVATVRQAGQPLAAENDGDVAVHRIEGLLTRLPWYASDPRRRYLPPFPEPAIVLGLRRLIRRLRPDVVHAHGWIAYSCAGALLGSRVPLVISARDYGYSCATRTLLHAGALCSGPAPAKCLGCAARAYGLPKAGVAVGGMALANLLLTRKVAAVHSVSSFVRKIVKRDLLGERARTQSVRRGSIPDVVVPSFLVESREDEVERAHLERLPDEPFILFVGALQPHKGLGPLLDAYARLGKAPPLVLIGTQWHDTPSSFPEGIVVLKNLPHWAVMRAWERCLFGVAPSIWPDPLPGVVREAMSKGKAVIASAVGGNTDMVRDGETGLLVPPGDVDALAGAMRRLLDDPALRARLGGAGCEAAQQFAAQAIIPRFEALYQQLIATTPRPPQARGLAARP
jgi:glycosyltransferase involved in cell wall biosynthesis